MLRQRATLVYVLLWIGLIVFALFQRSSLMDMQEQLDEESTALEQKRSAMQLKVNELAAKEKQVMEMAKGVMERESATHTRATVLEVREQKVAQREREVEDRDKSVSSRQHQCCVSADSCMVRVNGLEENIRKLQQQHSHHLRMLEEQKQQQQKPTSPPTLAPLSVAPFTLDKNVKNISFLEHMALSWSFHRDPQHPVGSFSLMPWPDRLTFHKKLIRPQNPDFQIVWPSAPPESVAACDRFRSRMKGLWHRAPPLGHGDDGVVVWKQDASTSIVLKVNCNASFLGVVPPESDESYRLSIVESGLVEINATAFIGVIRALSTLSQLLVSRNSQPYLPLVEITDSPGLAWRGLLLDVSRHFHPMEHVMKLLDGMEFVKLNVLHWHLSDDQGFRVESKVFPKLHTVASEGEYFTQEQIKTVVREAALRGIRIVPEFDMPAHTGAILLAYPELAPESKGPSALPKNWGVLPWVLDPTRDAVYTWIDAFIKEMVTLFPDEYFHIGGDEVPDSVWKEPNVTSFMKLNRLNGILDLHTHFNKKMAQILGGVNRKMVGWDDITGDWLPKNVTVQIWRSWMPQISGQVAALGLRSISSAELYLDWTRTIKHYYKQSVGHGSVAGRIGGEACMWSEWTSHNIDNRIWPSLAAIAERFWHREDVHGGVSQMYARIGHVSNALAAIGIPHQRVYDLALNTLLTGKAFTYGDVLGNSTIPSNDAVRRLVNAVQPLNRVGAGEKHPLIQFPDALRPDSLEMRALASLCEQVTSERFKDSFRASLLRSYLATYAELGTSLDQIRAFEPPSLLVAAKALASEISQLAAETVKLIDALSEGKASEGANMKMALLNKARRLEHVHVGSDKLMLELAHVLETSFLMRL